MLFGVHSLLFHETFVEKDLPLLDKCKQLGFDAVEILPFDPDHFPAAQVRRAAADLGLVINTGYGMPLEYNTISPDAMVRRNGIDFSKRLIDLSVEAGAQVFGGMIYCGWGYLTGKMRTEQEWNWAVEGYREIAGYALKANPALVLGIEPVNRFESHLINIAADARRFISDVGMPNVKVHLDTFHMIREEDDFARAVRETGPALGYVHACESQRGIPGRGLIPWVAFFEALREVGYDGCVTIESFDPDMEKIAKLCCIWRKLADSPEQLASEGLKFLKSVHEQVLSPVAG
ncbi:MAG TPA: sugar phosphate isomerase/epimerase family protein [Bryobacteraceae bacterium]|nr:sugar phosphate isomerase/epimerase family protein [Bryobacteraceae bacterium]HPT29230.1 sugar phosphate isomerase/epimerase family protein [Bryobacteraceae bacterium]